ncbi:hypothetical protein KXV85_001367, partial [Aspergillus fumigatus]
SRPAHLQGRADLAARGKRREALRGRAPGRVGRRGEARLHRRPADAHPLQYRRLAPADRDRKARRERRAAAAQRGRIDADDRRRRTGGPPAQARPSQPGAGTAPRAAGGLRPAGPRERPDQAGAHALLLLGLPAQHLDPSAGGQPRHGRYRLPRHGPEHADPPHRPDLAYGRRGRELDRPVPLHHRDAHLPESRRRHLHPFRAARAPRGVGRRHQHHLQDPLQRRGRDDRRPACRGQLQRRPDRAS